MEDVSRFALLVVLVSAVGLIAVLSSYVSRMTRIPTPLIFFVGAIVAARIAPDLHTSPEHTVQRLATVALVVILFNGGTEIGLRRFRVVRGPILSLGLVGTLLTTAALACLGKAAFDLDWYQAVLLAAAIAPTDPAVVFSVLGQREIAGRSGVILQGESGANDPVGIALMASLLAAGSLSATAAWHASGLFLAQMLVGAALGLLGSRLLLWFSRRIPMPTESLYPLVTLACIFLLYGTATALEGSGFLAVFVAGILIGDERVPYKPETASFFGALASISEIVVFIALGLTVEVSVLTESDVWGPGLLAAGVLTLVVRPALIGLCLLPARLPRNETAFVLFAGLKGAVPILLGTYLLTEHVADGERLYGIVVVVVLLSVLVQGSLTPLVARLLELPVRTVIPEPWSIGIRLRSEPEGVHRVTIAAGSKADGTTVADLVGLPHDAWISLIVRDHDVLPATASTRLAPGDQVMVLAHPRDHAAIHALFAGHV